MEVTILDIQKKKDIDWANQHSDEVTLEEYCREMQTAENSDFISFEDHKKKMNEWLKAKL